MTPNFAEIRIQTPDSRGFHLWLPLFLLWIPGILLAPFILLAVLIACMVRRINALCAIGAFWAISCSLPGTDVLVKAPRTHIRFRLI